MLLAAGAGLAALTAQAAEPEPLDEEFLDYLSQLEGDEDDWTLFDSEEAKPQADAKPQPPKPASTPAATKTATAKVPAEKPAAAPAETKR